MIDRVFAEKQLAELYDILHPWGKATDDTFYQDLVMAAEAVLDVGCGTGLLLRKAREFGHTGRLVGLDPAPGMIAVARESPEDVEWVQGDLYAVDWQQEFDLVVMTGHAFQVFVEDDHIRDTLASVRTVLKDGGRFAFETRNPLVTGWERWVPENAVEVPHPDGGVIRMEHQYDAPVTGDVVSFTSTFTSPSMDGPQQSRSTLRFLDMDALRAFLTAAGLKIEELFGDFDRSPFTDTSPEIVVIARRE